MYWCYVLLSDFCHLVIKWYCCYDSCNYGSLQLHHSSMTSLLLFVSPFFRRFAAVVSCMCCQIRLIPDWILRIHTLSSTSSRGKPQRRALSQCSPRTVLKSHSPSRFVFTLTRTNTTDGTCTSSRCHATFSAWTLLFVSSILMLCTYTSNFALTYLHCIH